MSTTAPPNPPGSNRPAATEEDLWFLPRDPDLAVGGGAPFPVAPRAEVFGPDDWVRAEAVAGRDLAAAERAYGRLEERLRWVPMGAERLAVLCASAALEAQGDWVPPEKLALYLAMREGTTDEAQAFRAADWAVRRMGGGLDPRRDLRGYLGRHATDRDGLGEVDLFGEPARGPEFEALGRDWLGLVAELADLGMPGVALAGVAFHQWIMTGIDAPGAVLEAVIVASAIGQGATGGPPVPAMLGGKADLLARGFARERLVAWLHAVEQGCLRGLLELERMTTWEARARGATTDLSGRTPGLLIEALLAHPVLSAEMAAARSGASRAAMRRNLAEFERRGLVREVTGQDRYRFWRMAG